jgi:undecaprenyl-diphosphatase
MTAIDCLSHSEQEEKGMSRIWAWLKQCETRMFWWVNRKIRHSFLDLLFTRITHLGGATMTIIFALSLSVFSHGNWRLAGIQSCCALALSHIPVSIIKRNYPRLRPYLVLPETNTCKKPLTDPSFPSGHTTAIFSVTVPLMCTNPWLGTVLLPLASLVGMSRMYLGLHYPSDCLVGCFIGTSAALGVVALFT